MLIDEILLMKDNQTYEEFISDFFTNNYTELVEAAVKDTANTAFNPEDLLSELYLFLIDKQDKILNLQKIEGKEDKPLMRYCCQWMYSNCHLYKANAGQSNFQARFSPKKDYQVSDNITTDMRVEESGKDYWLLDNLSPEDQEKIQIIDHIVNNDLNPIEKKMYELLFIQNLNVPKLKLMMPQVSKYSLYNMINQLTAKISNLIQFYQSINLIAN